MRRGDEDVICPSCQGRGHTDYMADMYEQLWNENDIPDVDRDNPYARGWTQPRNEEIFCNDEYAYMAEDTFRALAEIEGTPYYCVGLMWRRSMMLYWFSRPQGQWTCNQRKIVIGE